MGGSSGKNRDATIKISSFNPQTWGLKRQDLITSGFHHQEQDFTTEKRQFQPTSRLGSASSFLATCKAGDVEDPSEDVEVRMGLGTCQGNCHPSINMGKI
jgi:hypothetical protein